MDTQEIKEPNPFDFETYAEYARAYSSYRRNQEQKRSKDYYHTPEVKARYKKQREQPDAKKKRKKYIESYAQNPINKARRNKRLKEYRQRPEVKTKIQARSKVYRKTRTPEAKENMRAYARKYSKIPKVREHRRKYMNEYNRKKRDIKNIPYFIYGSLRKGHYNYRAYQLHEKAIEIGVTKLHRYVLYNLGSYPAVIKSGRGTDSVLGELMHLQQDVSERIDRMELSAGYTKELVTVKFINTNKWQKAYVFIMSKKRLPYFAKRIPSGDYTAFKKGIEAKEKAEEEAFLRGIRSVSVKGHKRKF